MAPNVEISDVNVMKIFYPWPLIVLTFFCSLVADSINYYFNSYLPECIHALGVGWDSVGYEVGVINSIIKVGYTLGNIAAGAAMIKWGVQKTHLVFFGLHGISVLSIAFCDSIIYLRIAVAFVGFFTSSFLVNRTLITKFSEEDNRHDIAIWCYSSPALLATCLGPCLAGFLENPTKQYPDIFEKDSFLGRHPIFLINIVFGIIVVIITILATIIIPKDEEMKNHLLKKRRLFYEKRSPDKEYAFLINDIGYNDGASQENELESKTSKKVEPGRWTRVFYYHILRNPAAIAGILLFCGYGRVPRDGYLVLWPLWLETPISHQGIGLSTKQVSIIYLISGAAIFLISSTILQKFYNSFTWKQCTSICTLSLVLLLTLMPKIYLIKDRAWFMAAFTLLNVMIMTMIVVIMAAIQIFLQNSVPDHSISLLLCVNQCIGSISSSAYIPSITGLFTWSTAKAFDESNFPFDYRFVFYVMAFLTLVCYIPLAWVKERST